VADERITWTPANGLNVEDPAILVRPDQCVEARNMLFERGVARTRPHAVRDTYGFWPDPSAAKFRFARGMLVGADSPNSVVILSDGTLAKGPQAQALSQSGGGTLALGDSEFDNINVVNGVFVIGNNGSVGTNGMVRHDPATSDFTIVAGAQFRYYASLYSRALGAYKGTGSLETAHTVGWSIAGDETDWSGSGSGETVLAETPDEITGVRTVQNVVAVARSMGWTLGFATGDGLQPIRWETLVRHGRQGCPYPSTIADDGNELLWCGHDNVYHMDMNWSPRAIGGPIRRELLFWLARGVLFRGYTARMDFGPAGTVGGAQELSSPAPRLRYHLVPISRAGVPHYSFDVDARTWSRHFYSYPLLGGCEAFNLTSTSVQTAVTWCNLLFLDEATPDVLRWGDGASGAGVVADEGAFLRSGVFVVGDATHEYKVQRAHIVWARDGSHGVGDIDPAGVLMTVRCKQQQRWVEQQYKPLDAYQVAEGSEDWQATFIDTDGKPVGQLFQIALEIPPGFPLMIARIELLLSDAGEMKAGHFKQAA